MMSKAWQEPGCVCVQDIELWKLKEELLFTRIFFSKMYNNWTIFAPDGKTLMHLSVHKFNNFQLHTEPELPMLPASVTTYDDCL